MNIGDLVELRGVLLRLIECSNKHPFIQRGSTCSITRISTPHLAQTHRKMDVICYHTISYTDSRIFCLFLSHTTALSAPPAVAGTVVVIGILVMLLVMVNDIRGEL